MIRHPGELQLSTETAEFKTTSEDDFNSRRGIDALKEYKP